MLYFFWSLSLIWGKTLSDFNLVDSVVDEISLPIQEKSQRNNKTTQNIRLPMQWFET